MTAGLTCPACHRADRIEPAGDRWWCDRCRVVFVGGRDDGPDLWACRRDLA